MASKRKPKKPLVSGDSHDPRDMRPLMAKYVEWLGVQNYSAATRETAEQNLGYFADWCEERGIKRPTEVTRPIIERYQRWMFHYRKANGRPLGVTTQSQRIITVKGFFKWLTRTNQILYNPASELDLPKRNAQLPAVVLTPDQVETILNQPDTKKPLGIRDRAILECLYSTGMRRMEAAGLTVYSVNQERGTVMIRLGKGKKDRLIPIGERAIAWIEKYLKDVRPDLAVEPDSGMLFLSATGAPLTPDELTELVSAYIQKSGVSKTGACHAFRHSMATAMLDNGADLRFIQGILGHSSLESTTVYTHLSIEKLKEIHAATHPAAKLSREKSAEPQREQERQEMLDTIADEADDEPLK